MSWNTYTKQFEAYLKLERSLADNSIEAYLSDIDKLKRFLQSKNETKSPLGVLLADLVDFTEFLLELGFSPYSQARIISGIKAFFKFLMYEEVIDKDPSELLEAPKIGRKLPDTLSFEEIEQILHAIDLSTPYGGRDRAILETLYSSGLRVSEVVDLHISNIHEEVGFLKVVGKGSKERLVPIGREALKFIRIYRDQIRVHVPIQKGFEDHLFLNRRGKSLTRVFVFTMIKKLVEQAGIQKNVSPHTFRHSFATHLIEGGADLMAVKDMLGHESITTTEIYTHLDRDYLKQIITQYHPRS